MRLKLFILSIALAAQPAYAHVLDSQDDLPDRLVHQLVGVHHLPVTLLLVVLGVIVAHRWLARHSDR